MELSLIMLYNIKRSITILVLSIAKLKNGTHPKATACFVCNYFRLLKIVLQIQFAA
jgi:hypothetical protein